MTARIDPADLRAMAARAAHPETDETDMMLALRDFMISHATINAVVEFGKNYVMSNNRQAALTFIDTFLPGYAFESGITPSRKVYAAVYAPKADMMGHVGGRNEALALFRAALGALADKIDAETLANCPDCLGHGVYVAADARRIHCHHNRAELALARESEQ